MPEEPDLSFPDPGNLQSRRGAVPLDRTLDRAVPLGPAVPSHEKKRWTGRPLPVHGDCPAYVVNFSRAAKNKQPE